MDKAREILRKYWGYSAFRPDQEHVIKHVLDGLDTLALLPTGGGKSICYQVPALINDGITIVISPLIALMNDQVKSLKERNIPALALTSGMSYREIDVGLENCVHGKYKFLYVSPERLKSDLFIERIKSMKVSLLAVDEAHCISQWGYDFRPSYLHIAEIREYLPDTPVLALTASATPKVSEDIQKKLLFKKGLLVRGEFARPELAYLTVHDDNKRERLHKILSKTNGTGIIYVFTRKEARELSEWLNAKGHNTKYYHAGLSNDLRQTVQEQWMTGRVKTVVSTNAFGMGIDKANVRLVVHLSFPASLEAYYQEAGRAGRDGKRAWALVLYNNHDIVRLKERVALSFPDLKDIKHVYKALANFFQVPFGTGEGRSFPFDITAFCKRYSLKAYTVFHAIKFLEKEEYISLSDRARTPSRIFIKASQNDLYQLKFQEEELSKVVSILLRSYTGLFDDYTTINESVIANRLKISRYKLIKQLQYLMKLGVMDYREQSDIPWLTYVQERAHDINLYISPQNYDTLKKDAFQRMEKVVYYMTQTTTCRNKVLMNYFGIEAATNCGICDVCISQRKNNFDEKAFNAIREKLVKMAVNRLSEEEMVDSFPANKREDVIEIIRILKDQKLLGI